MEISCNLERVKNLNTVRHDFDIEWSLIKSGVTQLHRGHVFHNSGLRQGLSVNSSSLYTYSLFYYEKATRCQKCNWGFLFNSLELFVHQVYFFNFELL